MGPVLRPATLTGWGLTSPGTSLVTSGPPAELSALISRYADESLVSTEVRTHSSRGAIVRGLGRSYGDPAQNSGGLVLQLESSLMAVELDRGRGVVAAGGGVSLHDLLEILLPEGFFVPVTPGTRHVTVGGAIACDIHGKNHHLEGSFGNHVEEIDLLLADGTTVVIGPDRNPDLFWATVGGMGLTGIILKARFRLISVESSRCIVSTHRCDDIDSVMAMMTDGDDQHRYSVAWTDLLATGRHLGRSILWRGDHARLQDLDGHQRSDPLHYEPQHVITIPPLVPGRGFVNPSTSRLFNEMWFRRAPRERTGEIKSIPAFFHPLDAVGRWNRLYGHQGFLQYQFVVPFSAAETVKSIIEVISAARLASPLVVLKRFGSANPGLLSFPMPGWTLTVDIPAAAPGLAELLEHIDDMVLVAGGRHYLAKDAHMSADAVRRGYPRLSEWLDVRRCVDPAGLWQSDQARRLNLLERKADHD